MGECKSQKFNRAVSTPQDVSDGLFKEGLPFSKIGGHFLKMENAGTAFPNGRREFSETNVALHSLKAEMPFPNGKYLYFLQDRNIIPKCINIFNKGGDT